MQLPDRPNLRHLKDQAKDLFARGDAESLADAQFKIARLYEFASWPKLKAHVDSLERSTQLERAYNANDVERVRQLLDDHANELVGSGTAKSVADARDQIAAAYGRENWARVESEIESMRARGDCAALSVEITQLGRAIDRDDLAVVQELMTRIPVLHRAPLGYGRSGPLTCAASCPEPPAAARLAIVRWMLENGSDVHQGGDTPLMRCCGGRRLPMAELLVSYGADVNALWNSNFPIIFSPCEGVDPIGIKWLLERGANPNVGSPDGRYADTALDYVIGSYVRSPDLGECIDLLLAAGGTTKYNIPVVLDLLRGRIDRVVAHLGADAGLVSRRFPDLDFGTTGARMLMLEGATLLHVAAEYQSVEAAALLLNRGADVNARALVNVEGAGGQTAIFHAVTQRHDAGIPIVELLLQRGADLSARAKVAGHYERPGEVIDCTPLGYALRFEHEPGRGDKSKTVALLRARGGVE